MTATFQYGEASHSLICCRANSHGLERHDERIHLQRLSFHFSWSWRPFDPIMMIVLLCIVHHQSTHRNHATCSMATLEACWRSLVRIGTGVGERDCGWLGYITYAELLQPSASNRVRPSKHLCIEALPCRRFKLAIILPKGRIIVFRKSGFAV